MKSKIYIPRIDEYKAITLKDEEEFRRFISYGYNIKVVEVNGKLESISFNWNPYGYDYPPFVTVKVGEIFMYNVDDKDDYKVVNKIPDWWVVNGEE